MSIHHQFRAALLQAIHAYEQKKPSLSHRRQQDVIDLKALLNNTRYSNETFLPDFLVRLQRIQTGWWIFHTGRSQLRSTLMAIIHQPEFSLLNLLREEILELQARLAEKERALAQQQLLNTLMDPDVRQLKEKLIEKQERLEALEGELTGVLSERVQLQQRNTQLYQMNRRLIHKCANLNGDPTALQPTGESPQELHEIPRLH